MARHPTFASLSRQRRRAPPAALDLTRSAFSPIAISREKHNSAQIVDIPAPEVFDCFSKFEEEQARASAELEHTQAAFTASLEDDPLPGVRARSPTAYRSAGRAIPMEVEDFDRPVSPPRSVVSEPDKVGAVLPEEVTSSRWWK
ncbi:hypothetical protein RhiLY_13108 [Ceratobasidium sp. AG-Ba]|nr:hypothetical protein RhiLY_13108 [Ceratobasidium sp. AG-Ba]